MDLRIVRGLELPEEAIGIIVQFLKEIHPNAALIKALRFYREPRMYFGNRVMHAGLSVTGDGIRSKDPDYPWIFPRYMRGCSLMHMCYSKRDGEWLPHTQSLESDDESDDESEHESSYEESAEESEQTFDSDYNFE